MSKNIHTGAKDDDVPQKKKVKTLESCSTVEQQSLTELSTSLPRATISSSSSSSAVEPNQDDLSLISLAAGTTSISQPFGAQKIGRVWHMGDLQLSSGYHNGHPMFKITKGNILERGYQAAFLSAAEYFELRKLVSKIKMKKNTDNQLCNNCSEIVQKDESSETIKLGPETFNTAYVVINKKKNCVTIFAKYMMSKGCVTITAQEFQIFDKALNIFWHSMKEYHRNQETGKIVRFMFQQIATVIVTIMFKQINRLKEIPESDADDGYDYLFNNAYTDVINFSVCHTIIRRVGEQYPHVSEKLDLFSLFFQSAAQLDTLKKYVKTEYIKRLE